MAKSVGVLVSALRTLLFPAAKGDDLTKSHKVLIEEAKLLKSFAHAGKIGSAFVTMISDRMASSLEDGCHKQTLDVLQNKIDSKPGDNDMCAWGEVFSQRARIDVATSLSFKEMHAPTLKSVDERLESTRTALRAGAS